MFDYTYQPDEAIIFDVRQVDQYNLVHFTILCQPRRGHDLCEAGETFCASNGLKIISSAYPSTNSLARNIFYVCGASGHLDDNALKCTTTQFKRIVEAVRELTVQTQLASFRCDPVFND